MISTNRNFLCDALSWAQQIGYHVRESRAGYLDGQFDSPVSKKGHRLRPGNPENIDSGSCGILLFIIELYRATGKDEFLKQARDLSDHLYHYCKGTPSNDYSLFTGRSGLIYSLIRLYSLTKDENLLNRSLDIFESFDAETSDSEIVTDDLYSGRSGVLLCLLNLYKITGESSIYKKLCEVLRQISRHAIWDRAGISWENNVDIHNRPQCGFAYGVSGITYVLRELSACFESAGLNFLIQQAEKYLANCWVDEFGNWADYKVEINSAEIFKYYESLYREKTIPPGEDTLGWRHGILGIGFSLLNDPSFSFHQARISKKLVPPFPPGESSMSLADSSLPALLFSSISANLTNSSPSYEPYQLEDSLSKYIYDQTYLLDTSLMHGALGPFYCLLKCINLHEDRECILIPFYGNAKVTAKEKLTILGPEGEMQKQLLSRYFFRTIELVETISPSLAERLTSDKNGHYPDDPINTFETYIQNELIRIEGSPIHDYLEDVFILECQKVHFAQAGDGNNVKMYLDAYFNKESAVRHLNCTNNEMKELTLVQSGKLKTITSKWDWGLKDGDHKAFTPLANIHIKPGAHPLIVHRHSGVGVREITSGVTTAILRLFASPILAGMALQRLKEIFLTLPEEQKGFVIMESQSQNYTAFMERFDFIFFHKVRQLIFEGCLQVK